MEMPSNCVGSHLMSFGFTYTEPPIVGSIFDTAFPAFACMDSSNRYAQHYHTVKAQRPEFQLIDKHVPKLARTLLQGLKRRAEQGRQRTPGISCPERRY